MKEKHKIAYMKCAFAFADCSNDSKLKVGAIIVKDNRIISCGYNGHAEHIHDPNQLPGTNQTDPRVRHAEKNALLGLTKTNMSSIGSILFCTHSCCEPCAIDIVDCGIKEFYYYHDYRCNRGLNYLKNQGVIVHKMENIGD